MCGIAGWFSESKPLYENLDIIESMSGTLCRRGPDEHGIFMDNTICLIHRRLTVIDPDNGKQPMTAQLGERDVTLVYNGELYNTEELRKELIDAGFTFQGHSDTEVLLNAYLHWGENCVNKLNGIFAFAVYDNESKKLFMARDAIGVKPFFYYQYNDGFIFGSEIKTLLANPIVKPQIDETGLMEIFFLGPGRTNGSGIFKGIGELLPGECAVYNNGTLKKRRYFKLTAEEHSHNKQQTIEYTRFLLTDAVERQLVSDVPLCTFLSGGLDSSIISNIAANYFKNKGKILDTYSVNYVDNQKYFQKSLFQPNSDEEFIDIMTEHVGSNHHQVILENTNLYNALFDSVDARDLPGMVDVDSSLLLFCREVKKDFTVALSGECADELFGGYPW
ncbi:MAG: asparagine synthase (glutamine-hydrolyzing) [Clostridia bacterium]|nr:asparagine synthase (glutamine-hydrolyzing) [Clostridia bacterium]